MVLAVVDQFAIVNLKWDFIRHTICRTMPGTQTA